ncbi:hypothetical protein [Streptomyces sp. NPDC007991]|uniref:hypothetical protein n=1 Tax=Streptomyces sp. NPDC007991 TaxID=3364803 RepID=UPI0036E0638F
MPRWPAPVAVVVSFVPDLALLGSGPPAVVALMVMHVVVGTVALLACRGVLPLPVR